MDFRKPRKVLPHFLIFILTLSYVPESEGFFLDFSFLQSILDLFGATTGSTSSESDSFGDAVKTPTVLSKRSSGFISPRAFESNSVDRDSNKNHKLERFNQNSKRKRMSKCFEELGCLEITPAWFNLLHRPFNVLPQDRWKINTRFILYTRDQVTDPIQVFRNSSNLLESGFQPNKPVKFVVHGYLDSAYVAWVTKLSQQMTTREDVNVIAVDWSAGALAGYVQASANTRVVGLEIAYFIKFLKNELNVNPAIVHIIGHSLGAQTAGYAGEQIPGLGRITGLDPAAPLFHYMPTFVRLDPGDATFVDVIHSDGTPLIIGGLGFVQPCGHMDFYPNNGKKQPGCTLTQSNIHNSRGIDDLARVIAACNHHRAVYYFIESLLSKQCLFIGHICTDYESYLNGHCNSCGNDGSLCAKMGIDADRFPIEGRSLLKFYVSTAKAPPYCVHHYQVNVQFLDANPQNVLADRTLRISVKGELSAVNEIEMTPMGTWTKKKYSGNRQSGKTLSFTIQSPKELGAIQKISIEWKSDVSSKKPNFLKTRKVISTTLRVKSVEIINIDDISVGANLTSARTILCGEKGAWSTELRSGIIVAFQPEC